MSIKRRIRRSVRSALGRSDLDAVITPEIHDDAFARLVTHVAARPDVRTAIDIGASAGAGSSAALFHGLKTKDHPLLVCLELSETRFEKLCKRFAPYDWVHCLNDSSVPLGQFPSDENVRGFIETHGGRALYSTPTEEVMRWLRQDREYLVTHDAAGRGIVDALELVGADTFDVVLIDGSEFTGAAELDLLYGAPYILLDDVRTYKNHRNRQRLLADPDYQLIAEDIQHRNGYSAFGRR